MKARHFPALLFLACVVALTACSGSGEEPLPKPRPWPPPVGGWEAREVTVLRRVPLPSGGLVPYQRGNLWGFSDTTGRLIIAPWFREEPSVFTNGYAFNRIMEAELDALMNQTVRPFSAGHVVRFFNARGDMISASATECIISTPEGLRKRPRRGYAGRPEVVGIESEEAAVNRSTSVDSDRQLSRHTLADGSSYYLWEAPATPPGRLEVAGNYLGEGCFRLEERAAGYYRNTAVSLIDGSGRNRTWFWQRYDKIRPFSGGRATVERGGNMGAIDRRGREVVPLKYAGVRPFHHNRAVVTIRNPDRSNDDFWALIDTMGHLVTPPRSYPLEWRQRFVALQVDEEGLVYCPPVEGQSGRFIVPAGAPPLADNQFDAAEPFTGGRAWVVRRGRVGLIDRRGRWVTPLPYDSLYHVVQASELGVKKTGQNGFSPSVFRLDERSDPNYMIGYREGYYGIVDRRTGREVIPARYDWVDAGINKVGRALLWRDGIRYLVLATGEEVCPFPFGSGIIDSHGDWLNSPQPLDRRTYLALRDAPPPLAERKFTGGRWPFEYPSKPARWCFTDFQGNRVTACVTGTNVGWIRATNRL